LAGKEDFMSTSIDKKVRLYELALQDGRSASPFVWRIRYALAHKGIPFETVYLGFTEIPTVFDGKFKTVPILEHAGAALAESWDIAEYLDRAFPHQPLLFNTPAELSLVRFLDAWFMGEVMRKCSASISRTCTTPHGRKIAPTFVRAARKT
jgi:glutathione S-transferase